MRTRRTGKLNQGFYEPCWIEITNHRRREMSFKPGDRVRVVDVDDWGFWNEQAKADIQTTDWTVKTAPQDDGFTLIESDSKRVLGVFSWRLELAAPDDEEEAVRRLVERATAGLRQNSEPTYKDLREALEAIVHSDMSWDPRPYAQDVLDGVYSEDGYTDRYEWKRGSITPPALQEIALVLGDKTTPPTSYTPVSVWYAEDQFRYTIPEIDGSKYARARHPLSQRFHDLLKQAGDTHDRKQADYGRENDPFANVRATESWGQPAWVGAMIRLDDKVRRLQAHALGSPLKNEGALDSFMDIAVYALIAYVLYEEDTEVNS